MGQGMRYYDPRSRKIVYCLRQASPVFWDEHWNTKHFSQLVRSKNSLIVKYTSRYLTVGSKLLEGGCGRGNIVYSLHEVGFDAYGIDWARETLAMTKRYVPELKICVGDVRCLPYKKHFFDGYWSLGVIEHFYDGYDEIAKEMFRVIRKDGYLFLAFPYMHPLRKIKARMGCYPKLPKGFDAASKDFYQYALDETRTLKNLQYMGFDLVFRTPLDGVKGLKDEVAFISPLLQRIYDSRSIPGRVLKRLLNLVLAPWCGHSILMIFKKNQVY
jgi:ubiquinone/menaquinone biosynthesis C-methylase UbiE